MVIKGLFFFWILHKRLQEKYQVEEQYTFPLLWKYTHISPGFPSFLFLFRLSHLRRLSYFTGPYCKSDRLGQSGWGMEVKKPSGKIYKVQLEPYDQRYWSNTCWKSAKGKSDLVWCYWDYPAHSGQHMPFFKHCILFFPSQKKLPEKISHHNQPRTVPVT